MMFDGVVFHDYRLVSSGQHVLGFIADITAIKTIQSFDLSDIQSSIVLLCLFPNSLISFDSVAIFVFFYLLICEYIQLFLTADGIKLFPVIEFLLRFVLIDG